MKQATHSSFERGFGELRQFVGLGDQDRAMLQELAVHARPRLDDIARLFYERAREHEEAHAVFQDETQIERLHVSMVSWLLRVLDGPYDEAYIAETAKVGRLHVHVGLPLRFVFAAMGLFRVELMRVAFEHMSDRALEACTAVNRVLDLELAIIAETYTEAETRRRERLASLTDAKSHATQSEQALTLVDTAVIALDEQFRVVLFNEEATRLTGFERIDVLGESFLDLFGLEGGGLETALRRAPDLAAGEYMALSPSVLLKTRKGSTRQLAGRVVRPPDGHGVMCFVIGRDVTHRMAIEARLRRSEKLAAIGTMAAGLAHEIRNPLNGAQLHMTFIRRGLQRLDDTEELVAASDVVNGEIRRLGDLVSEFLDFARPHALQRSHVVLQELCQRTSQLLSRQAQDAEVEIVCNTPTTPVIAEVDSGRIEQVLLNLLRNAIEAVASSKTQPKKVELRLVRRPRDALFLIIDEGPGLAADAPIWDAFFSTKQDGTGLGLAIVHRIVTDHGGHVSVESEPGRTVFRVEIPLSDPEKPPASVLPGAVNPNPDGS